MNFLSYLTFIIKLSKANICLFFMSVRANMNVKKVLRFYFCAESAQEEMDRLIAYRALRIDFARGAEECVAEVAELVARKGEMCGFYRHVHAALSRFSRRELCVLKDYAFGRRAADAERRREIHRLAVAFSRRIRGCLEKFARGVDTAMRCSFQA